MKIRICFIFFFACCSIYAGQLRGIVTNAQTGKPVAHVNVVVLQNNKSCETDSAGAYYIDSIAPGGYGVSFAHLRFEQYSANDVYISGEGEKRLDVELTPVTETLEKIVVRGVSFRKAPEMSTSSKVITADELLRAPGALADVQRVVQNLPSVSSGGDQTNEIVVRGGTPGENLFVMDNMEIPNPNHFAGEGSGGGVISLVNPLLVKGLVFSAGAPPAQYGDKASSALDVKLRDGNKDMVLGGVDLGVAGAGFHAEGPVGGVGNFMLSATKSFLDVAANSVYNNTATAIPQYWGTQMRLAHGSPTDKIYANGIFGNNGITIGNARMELGTRGDTIKSGGNVYAAGGTWEHFCGDHLSTSLTASAVGNTFDRLEFIDEPQGAMRDTFYSNASREQEQTVKAQASYDFDNSDKITVGVYGRRCDYSINTCSSADTLKRYANSGDSAGVAVDLASGNSIVFRDNLLRHGRGYKYGGFVSAIVRLYERTKIVPGLRFDGFTENETFNVSPRLSGVYSITPDMDMTCAAGLQYQQPDYAVLAANPECPAKRAMTCMGGLEYFLSDHGVQLVCEGFYKRYDHSPVDSSLLMPRNSVEDSFCVTHGVAAIGAGRSFGLEFFVQKKLVNEFSWTASYSLSDSKYKDPRSGHAGQWYEGDYNFGRSFTITGGWKKELLQKPWYVSLRQKTWFKVLSPVFPIGDRNEISVKWRYLGGRPYTQSSYDTIYHRWYVDEQKALNNAHYPDYHSMDFRWERRFGFGFLQMMYYIDFQNVYGRNNVWQYFYVDGKSTRSTVYQLPFFPAGGMIIGF